MAPKPERFGAQEFLGNLWRDRRRKRSSAGLSGGGVGAPGATGNDAGLGYSFDTATGMADPGTGDVRFNNGTIASVTQIAVSDTDDYGNDNDGVLDTWDDSTTTGARGYLCIVGDAGQLAIFQVTGAITDQGTWHQIPVSYVAGTLFSNDEALRLQFFRTGDLGATGATGATGGTGATGATGRDAGINYQFNTNTASSDPGSGKLKFNNATLSSATELYISETDDDGGGIAAYLATWDDSTTTLKGFVVIRKVGTPATFAIFSISGTLTDNGSWDTFTVSHVASNGSFSNNDETMVSFHRTGDKGSDGSGSVTPSVCDGRLSLVSGDAVPSADQTGKTTVYWVPYLGGKIALYSGGAWAEYTPGEKSVALGTITSGKNYDVFGYVSGGTLALEILAWSTDTARATALTTQDGVPCKSGDTTRRYLGTFRTTSTTQTEDSAAKRFLWNAYHRVRRTCKGPIETTDTWTYTTDTWRQARATATNCFEYVCGLAEDAVDATVIVTAYGSAVATFSSGIGIDSTTTNSAQTMMGGSAASIGSIATAVYRGVPGLGYHAVNWLERSYTTTGTTTWTGDAGIPNNFQSGITGTVMA